MPFLNEALSSSEKMQEVVIKKERQASRRLAKFSRRHSPDMNPFEHPCNGLRSWMRRNHEIVEEFGDWYEGFMVMAIESAITLADGRRCFDDAEVNVYHEDVTSAIVTCRNGKNYEM